MTAVNYLWDPVEQNIVRELDDSGNVIAQYTTEPSLYGDLLSQRRNGQDSYYHYDGQGSTVALTNSNGDVTDTYEYSAFGEVTEHTGSTVNPFQYIGQKQYYRDEENCDYDVRRRPLSSNQERWCSPDPFESIDQLDHHGAWNVETTDVANLYSYANNSPLDNVDPAGLVAVSAVPRPCTPAETTSANAQCKNKFKAVYHPFLISGCLQATDIRTYLAIPVIGPAVGCVPIPTGFVTKTTTCCWGPCQFYERWCKFGVRLPKGDPGKPFWPIQTSKDCEACGDACMLNKGDWKCKMGGGPRGPRWPTIKAPFALSWPDDDGTNLEVLLCQGLAIIGGGGKIIPKTP